MGRAMGELVLVLAICAAPACHVGPRGPSAARRSCVSDCERRNESCLLSAHDSNAVQSCDWDRTQCMRRCPR